MIYHKLENLLKKSISFVIFFCFLSFSIHAHILTINIFSVKNGKGLELDRNILRSEFEKLDCLVYCKEFDASLSEAIDVDVNIFLEIIVPSWFPFAKSNWFIPNPEWFKMDHLNLLDSIDLVLCKTKETEKIFNQLNCDTYFLGFTSLDCYDPLIPKDYNGFVHLAGGSNQKGTLPVLKAWKNNPEFPLLTVIKWGHYLNASPHNICWISNRVNSFFLRSIQNEFGVHLCPSEAEGFGHYIMEAMSTKAVVVTTDAPPMNEFVTQFLVPYQSSSTQALGTNYYVSQEMLEDTINNILKLPVLELQKIGNLNRKLYLRKTRDFQRNLKVLIEKAHLKKSQNLPDEICLDKMLN